MLLEGVTRLEIAPFPVHGRTHFCANQNETFYGNGCLNQKAGPCDDPAFVLVYCPSRNRGFLYGAFSLQLSAICQPLVFNVFC